MPAMCGHLFTCEPMKPNTMLYKAPGPHDIHGGKFDHVVVDDEFIQDKLAEGWFLTTTEAAEAYAAQKLAAPVEAPDTREDMERKARDLGIKFDGRTTDKKLAFLIEERQTK